MRTIGVGGGAVGVIIVLLLTLLGGGGDLSGLTEVLQPAGGCSRKRETRSTIGRSRDRSGCLPRGGLQDTQGMWVGVFEESGLEYRPTNLVLFNGFTQSVWWCAGTVRASLLPDRRVRLHGPRLLGRVATPVGAAGDTAQAYILAHEVGHHVQHQLGITEQVQSAAPMKRVSPWSPGRLLRRSALYPEVRGIGRPPRIGRPRGSPERGGGGR